MGVDEKRAIVWALGLTAIAVTRIVATYGVFNQTHDEPLHLACGMEWLQEGEYRYEEQHPPLARVAAALGPFAAGLRISEEHLQLGTQPAAMTAAGNGILHGEGRYFRNLALARAGILPFFLLATAVVFVWARRQAGVLVAVVAVALFTSLPPVLAHAGLATTDMAAAATLIAALWAFHRWLESPDMRRSAVLGGAVALAVLCKFSAFPFLPAAGLALVGWHVLGAGGKAGAARGGREWKNRWRGLALAAAVAAVVVWAGYRFSVGGLGREGALHDWYERAVGVPWVPAPELVAGVREVVGHQLAGHPSVFLGQVRPHGVWYFFPVVLAIKTPLAFLLLTLAGAMGTGADHRRRLAPAACALAILSVAMTADINIGVRHVLVVYPLLAMVAAGGLVRLWSCRRHRVRARVVAAGLAGWFLASSAWAHPDYLAYFNEIAQHRPEQWTCDSDLDWGQDLHRLGRELRERGAEEVALAYFGTADPERFGLPVVRPLVPGQRATGWVAVSLMTIQLQRDGFRWLRDYQPVARVGRSILLYRIPADGAEIQSRRARPAEMS